MKDEVSRNIIENYEKFKAKTKDEVSSFNQNGSKNEIFCNPGAKIIYGDSGVISLHHHRRTSGDPIFRNMTGVYLTKLDPWNYKKDQPAFPDLLSSQGQLQLETGSPRRRPSIS